MQRLYFPRFVHFKNIDAFKVRLVAALADSASRPFHRRAIAGDEYFVFRQANLFEGRGNRLKKACSFIARIAAK